MRLSSSGTFIGKKPDTKSCGLGSDGAGRGTGHRYRSSSPPGPISAFASAVVLLSVVPFLLSTFCFSPAAFCFLLSQFLLFHSRPFSSFQVSAFQLFKAEVNYPRRAQLLFQSTADTVSQTFPRAWRATDSGFCAAWTPHGQAVGTCRVRSALNRTRGW
jgi:hypothetical protein